MRSLLNRSRQPFAVIDVINKPNHFLMDQDLWDDLEDLGAEDKVDDLVQVFQSRLYTQTMTKIKEFLNMNRTFDRITSIENDMEFQTIVDANSIAFDLDYESSQVQKVVTVT
jgi:hypothetical protein